MGYNVDVYSEEAMHNFIDGYRNARPLHNVVVTYTDEEYSVIDEDGYYYNSLKNEVSKNLKYVGVGDLIQIEKPFGPFGDFEYRTFKVESVQPSEEGGFFTARINGCLFDEAGFLGINHKQAPKCKISQIIKMKISRSNILIQHNIEDETFGEF